MDTDQRRIILQCFDGIASNSNEVRAQAEQHLVFLESQPGFGISLAQLALDASVPLHFRQLSAIELKRFVALHWSEGEEGFVAPQVQVGEKNAIKQLLPNGLADPESKIRTAVAMAIASIAHWDYPDEWPGIIENLMGCLQSNNETLMTGGIKCLDMFCDGENLTDDQLPHLMRILFPHVLKIFTDTRYSVHIRTRALSVAYSLVRWLAIIKQQHKEDLKVFFAQVVPGWMQVFVQVLAQPDSINGDCGMKITILNTLIVLLSEFPVNMKPFLPALMEPIWNGLVNGQQIYERSAVLEDLIGEAAQDEEGESVGFEALVMQMWEFMHTVMEKQGLRTILKSNMPAMAYIAIGYMQITVDEEELWSSDPNQYAADEEDSEHSNNDSVRSSANKLIADMISQFGVPALEALCAAASKRVTEAFTLRQQNVQHWWKLAEAALTALGYAAEDLTDFLKQKGPTAIASFDPTLLAQQVILPILQDANLPFLRGCALWCASRFAEVVPAGAHPALLAATAQILSSPTEQFAVKIAGSRAVISLCPHVPEATQLPYLSALIRGVLSMIPQAREDTLHFVLDAVLIVVKVSETATQQHLDVLLPCLLAVWGKFFRDNMLMVAVGQCIGAVARFSSCHPVLVERVLPALLTVLKDTHDIPGLTESALDFLAILINHAPAQLPEALIVHAFPLVIARMQRTDDNGILQSSTTCLSAFVRKAGPQLGQWKPDGTNSALDLIIHMVAKLLNPNTPEHAALHVGSLISKLIQAIPGQLGQVLPQMLGAVVNRLQSAQMLSLIQPLILIFARLVHSHHTEVVEFLANMTVTAAVVPAMQGLPPGPITQTALSYVLGVWTRWHEDFQGAYYIRLSISALAKLYQSPDPRLVNIVVPGEQMLNPNEGIKTRSKARETPTVDAWSALPLKAKLLTLLVREYQIAEEQGNNGEDEEDYDSEEEDDDANTTSLSDLLGSPFVDASVVFPEGEDEWETEEADDPDAQDDPIAQIDLKATISDLLKLHARSDFLSLQALGNMLAPSDQQALQRIVNT